MNERSSQINIKLLNILIIMDLEQI
jgi:hypothetical protein